jgi:murein DD-endopeptidase MepM/ murein hydrolase activator NlpD
VLTSALLGAGVVVFAAGAALPDHARSSDLTSITATADLSDRVGGDDRASHGVARNAAAEFNQPAPDVWLLPLKTYEVTSTFGMRWGVMHAGVDLGAREGTPMYAVAAGVVALCKWNGGYGYNVEVNHGGGITTVYGHASALKCREGQKVQAGDLIALVGNTGNSYGAHLHFEVRQGGTPVEPIAFMKKRGVDLPNHGQAIYGDKVN